MKKKFIALLLTLVCVFSLMGCSKKAPSISINIASLKGPTSIGLVKLYSDSDNNESYNKYNYSIHGTADEISTKLIKGELDVAAIPANLASILYNKSNGEIIMAGINTLGVLYILTKGENINSVADLKGKTIYTTGQGTTPEYTLRYILEKNDLDPDKDVTIEFCSEASEVAAKAVNSDNIIVMLPEPYVEVAKSMTNVEVALDLTEEWRKCSGGTIVTGVIVARKEFIDNNKKSFDKFLEEYKDSTNFANSNIEECAELLEKYDIFKAAIAKKAIPACNVTFINDTSFVKYLTSYFNVLFNANKASIGGKIPDGDAFYIK